METEAYDLHPFLFMGCWNEALPSPEPRNAVAAAIRANPVPTLILGGDNVYPKKQVVGEKKMKTYSLELLNEGLGLFAEKHLHIALGNHNVDAPEIQTRVMEIGRLTNRYYCKTFRDAYALVVIDTNLVDTVLGPPMLEWIARTVRTLQESGTRYYFIQHEPFLSYKKGKAEQLDKGVDILRLLAAYPPILILCADTHNYQELMITVGGVSIPQIVVGTGGAHPDPFGDTSETKVRDDIVYTLGKHTEGFGYLQVNAPGDFAFQNVAPWSLAGGGTLRRTRTRQRRRKDRHSRISRISRISRMNRIPQPQGKHTIRMSM
jgi:hypothetical protein